MEFRVLTPREIDCRVQQIKDNGVSLLLYKDARCDMSILDSTVGSERWQRKHDLINGNLFCSVGINFDGEWVWKQDVGTESNTEKEKGQASDSFKRACVNWGIGRELYSAPFIWIPADKAGLTTNNGKRYCNTRFAVSEIEYDSSREIVKLVIVNDKTYEKVFSFNKKRRTQEMPSEAQETPVEAPDKTHVCIRCGKRVEPFKTAKKEYSAEWVVSNALLKYGDVYCAGCQAVLKSEFGNG